MKTPNAISALAESYGLDYVFTSQGNLPYKRIISLLEKNKELPDEYEMWEKFEHIAGKELATVINGATDGYTFFLLGLAQVGQSRYEIKKLALQCSLRNFYRKQGINLGRRSQTPYTTCPIYGICEF